MFVWMNFAMQLARINKNNYFSKSIKKYVVLLNTCILKCINKKVYYAVGKCTCYIAYQYNNFHS